MKKLSKYVYLFSDPFCSNALIFFLSFYLTMLFQDPENGEICQVAGWGRVQREKTYTDDEGNERKHKGPVDLMEVC